MPWIIFLDSVFCILYSVFDLFQIQILKHRLGKVFSPATRSHHAVGHALQQFILGSSMLLRDREVFFQSVGTLHRDSTGDPDQFTGFDIKNFWIVKIKKFLADIHRQTPWFIGLTYGYTAADRSKNQSPSAYDE